MCFEKVFDENLLLNREYNKYITFGLTRKTISIKAKLEIYMFNVLKSLNNMLKKQGLIESN